MEFTREERKSVKFAHFQLGNFGERKDGSPIKAHATVASIEKEGYYYYGIALCAPEDNFCRAEGRVLARLKLMCPKQAKFTTGYIYPVREGERNTERALEALKYTITKLQCNSWNATDRWYSQLELSDIKLKSRKNREISK